MQLQSSTEVNLGTNAIESFIFFSGQTGGSSCNNSTPRRLVRSYAAHLSAEALLSQTQACEWTGQLELARNHPAEAATAFEQALSENDALMRTGRDQSRSHPTSTFRAVMGLVETSLFAGNFQRAISLLGNPAVSCDLENIKEQDAQIYHLRARAYAGLGFATAALKEFSNAIATYTTMLQTKGIQTETSTFAHDLEDPYKCPVHSKKAGHRRLDLSRNSGIAAYTPLSPVQSGRAMVYYHLSLFRAAMILKLGMPATQFYSVLTTNDRGSPPKINCTEDNSPSAHTSKLKLPDILKTHLETADVTSHSKAPHHKTSLYSAVACLVGANLELSGISLPKSCAPSEAQCTDATQRARFKVVVGEPRNDRNILNVLGLEELSEAVKQNPDFIGARLARAELHVSGGNFALAFADFDAVLRNVPHCVDALVNRAILFIQLGNNTIEARANLDEAIAISDSQRKIVRGGGGDGVTTLSNSTTLNEQSNKTALGLALFKPVYARNKETFYCTPYFK